jgi:hypothetical protein
MPFPPVHRLIGREDKTGGLKTWWRSLQVVKTRLYNIPKYRLIFCTNSKDYY